MFDFDVASGAERYKIARFLDVYGGLLTEAQKEALSLYFNEDLSLGEISDIKGISRQGGAQLYNAGYQGSCSRR